MINNDKPILFVCEHVCPFTLPHFHRSSILQEAGRRKGHILAAKKQCLETAGLFAAVPGILRLRLVVLIILFASSQDTSKTLNRVSISSLSLMCNNMLYIVIMC